MFEANFTVELFKAEKLIRGDPNVYELIDREDEPITGKFHEEKLNAVQKKFDDVYRVDLIINRKTLIGKKMVLVKWLGSDGKHNSRIPESDIRDIALCIYGRRIRRLLNGGT